MESSGAERRGARRVDAKLSLQVSLPRPDGAEQTANLETINISTSGVYFRSDSYIAPMTKLALDLELGVPGAAADGSTDLVLVPCEGLVVRIEPEVEATDVADYEVAVFFTHLEGAAAADLERHIAMVVAQENA